MNSTASNVVDIHHLTRRFNDKAALQDVTVQIPRGQVFGIVGENGAGKTTLIKHILGLYRAQQGSVAVFGMDPVKHPKEVLSRIGYLSEQPDFPEWMTIAQFMNYMAAFYPNWDRQYATKLLEMASLDSRKKIRELSKGQQARVGLCAAQAHRPELLVLDEPSSGLDPVARGEILAAVIRTVVLEGHSVLLSSHLLEEVERVCDHLLFFSEGRVLLSDSMEAVLTKHHQVTLRLPGRLEWRSLPGVFNAVEDNGEWQLFCFADLDDLTAHLKQQDAQILDKRRLSLNEAFIARSAQRHIASEIA
ncbi:MAG TPA: ABC transporter ATP-binding protein [Steroidobacteraceae bacterium]